MALSAIITYEIYYMGVSGWMLHSRHPSDKRDEAIDEARNLEADIKKAVKVVRETYSMDTGSNTEQVIWTGRVPPEVKAAPVPRTGASASSAAYSGPDRRVGPRRHAPPPKGAPNYSTRLIIILGITLVIGIVIAGSTGNVLLSSYSDSVSTASRLFLMLMAFILSLVVVGGGLILHYIPTKELFGEHMAKSTQARDIIHRKKVDRRKQAGATVVNTSTEILQNLKQKHDASKPPVPAKAAAQQPTVEAPPASAPVTATAAEAKAAPAATEPPQKPAAEQKPTTPPAPTPPTPTLPPTPAMPEPTPAPAPAPAPESEPARLIYNERVRADILQFISGAVGVIRKAHPQLDSYARFGVNLYIVGACEALRDFHKLSPTQFAAVIHDATTSMGTKHDVAVQLTTQLSALRMVNRYAETISTGKSAMQSHLRGHTDPFAPLGRLLKAWEGIRTRPIAAHDTTIVVSGLRALEEGGADITEATLHAHLKAHTRIAHHAFLHFDGREIGEAGQDIVASFDDPLRASLAALEIQQSIGRLNRGSATPLRFHLAIDSVDKAATGLDADLVTATIHSAKSLAALSQEGEILITPRSRTLMPETSRFVFRSHDPVMIDGSPEPQEVFAMVWADGAMTVSTAAPPNAAPVSPSTSTAAAIPPEKPNPVPAKPASTSTSPPTEQKNA